SVERTRLLEVWTPTAPPKRIRVECRDAVTAVVALDAPASAGLKPFPRRRPAPRRLPHRFCPRERKGRTPTGRAAPSAESPHPRWPERRPSGGLRWTWAAWRQGGFRDSASALRIVLLSGQFGRPLHVAIRPVRLACGSIASFAPRRERQPER